MLLFDKIAIGRFVSPNVAVRKPPKTFVMASKRVERSQ